MRRFVAPALFTAVTAGLWWNIITGDRGWIAGAEHQKLLVQAQQDRDDAERERVKWKRRVINLGTKTLDRDYLDERPRATSGRASRDEIIVRVPPNWRD